VSAGSIASPFVAVLALPMLASGDALLGAAARPAGGREDKVNKMVALEAVPGGGGLTTNR
jgi:hypothetical protein